MRTSEHEHGEILRRDTKFRERSVAAATFSVAVIDSEGRVILANRAIAEVSGSEVLVHGLSVSSVECELICGDGARRTLKFSLQQLIPESVEPGPAAEDGAWSEVEEKIELSRNTGGIVGESAALKKALYLVERVAATSATVLILGETGTGKELCARAVHNLSARKDSPFIKVDCGAIPAGLIESELFGHEKGAFTGAIGRRLGRFELADQGTIFLDEIGDLPLDLQTRLLRVLQEGAFERVGGTRTIKTNVRVVAATNRDLRQRIKSGAFRKDLYYRLGAFPILLPPLRERREDIPLLALHFLKEHGARLNKKIMNIPQQFIETLRAYHFPGNVRELENIIERAVILSTGASIPMDVSFISPRATEEESQILEEAERSHITRALAACNATEEESQTLEEAERSHITRALAACNWRIEGPQGAARRLGLHPSTLRSRMRKLDINRP